MKNMHKVSDEDFDKLFQEKLYHYETAPTDAVWADISNQLGSKKAERHFPILRIAAASLAGIVGLGIWMAATKEPIKLSGTSNKVQEFPTAVAPLVLKKPKIEAKAVVPVEIAIAAPKVSRPERSLVREEAVASRSHSSDVVVDAQMEGTKSSVLASTVKPAEEQPVKSASPSQKADKVASLALASETFQEEDADAQIREKKIKSVGTLVNFVVGKIDKRKEKLIEFEDSDEGTKVSGLNLGLLKFKARE